MKPHVKWNLQVRFEHYPNTTYTKCTLLLQCMVAYWWQKHKTNESTTQSAGRHSKQNYTCAQRRVSKQKLSWGMQEKLCKVILTVLMIKALRTLRASSDWEHCWLFNMTRKQRFYSFIFKIKARMVLFLNGLIEPTKQTNVCPKSKYVAHWKILENDLDLKYFGAYI